jgi:hypothetical protein
VVKDEDSEITCPVIKSRLCHLFAGWPHFCVLVSHCLKNQTKIHNRLGHTASVPQWPRVPFSTLGVVRSLIWLDTCKIPRTILYIYIYFYSWHFFFFSLLGLLLWVLHSIIIQPVKFSFLSFFFCFSVFCFCFWDRILLCSPGWCWTHNPPASTS